MADRLLFYHKAVQCPADMFVHVTDDNIQAHARPLLYILPHISSLSTWHGKEKITEDAMVTEGFKPKIMTELLVFSAPIRFVISLNSRELFYCRGSTSEEIRTVLRFFPLSTYFAFHVSIRGACSRSSSTSTSTVVFMHLFPSAEVKNESLRL